MSAAKLVLRAQEFESPLVVGSENECGIDITKLRAQTKAVTLDSGYGNTGSGQSAITFIEGEESILLYRGYRMEQLAEHAAFPEVCYLVVNGEFTNQPTTGRLSRTTDLPSRRAECRRNNPSSRQLSAISQRDEADC